MEKDGIFMYCKRCGKKINDEWKYCPYCKESLIEENIGHDEMENKNMINKVNNEVKIYSLIFIISMICTFAIYKYFYIFFLVSLITIAIGFIKYPFNNIIKLLFKIFIVFCIFVFCIGDLRACARTLLCKPKIELEDKLELISEDKLEDELEDELPFSSSSSSRVLVMPTIGRSSASSE